MSYVVHNWCDTCQGCILRCWASVGHWSRLGISSPARIPSLHLFAIICPRCAQNIGGEASTCSMAQCSHSITLSGAWSSCFCSLLCTIVTCGLRMMQPCAPFSILSTSQKSCRGIFHSWWHEICGVHEVNLWQEAEVTQVGMCLGSCLLGLLGGCKCGLVCAGLDKCDANAFQLWAGQA